MSNVHNGHTAPGQTTRRAYQNAEQARNDAVQRLLSAAEAIRADAEDAPVNNRQAALVIARSLEQSANILNARRVDQVEAPPRVEDDSPAWVGLLIAFLLGIIAGRLILRRK